jgi:M6 family metalloprotease-like protein
MTHWKQRQPMEVLKVPKKYRLSVFACILVVLSLMFGNGSNNIGSVAYAEEGITPTRVPTPTEQPFAKALPTGPFPVEGQPGSLSGWFNIVWGDGPEGASQTVYTLTDDSGQITPLSLDETLSQSVGGVLWFDRKKVNVEGVWATSLSVQGAATGLLNVTSISLAPSPETGALSGDVSPAVSGSQPWVTIMCKFNNVATEPRNLAYFTGMYANVKPGLDHYWRELSYDKFNVAGSNAFGWFTLPQPESYYNPTDTTGGANKDALWTDCVNAADASVNFAPYVGINMMFNTDFDNGYAWGGSRYGTIDGVAKTWRVTWEPPWAYADISVIQHEMGHGFGLPHSSGAYGQTYDNAWDVMSWDRFNCAAATDPTYGCIAQGTISYHKDSILGVIPAGQKFTVPLGSSTTITLEQLALPATANYKMAQIPIGGSSTHFFTVEARRLTGYDSKLAGAAVIIHEVDTTRAIPAHVIDTDLNGNTADAGAMWVVGETFEDVTNNIWVQVDSATATGFQVSIANGSLPTSPDLIETAVSNPPVSATAGSSFSVTDTVENQGNASAGASITSYYFSMDTTRGSGDVLLTGSRSVPSLGVNGTNSGTISVTIPSGTASGSYYLLACADDTNTVAESNENNNCIASANKVNVSVAPGILSVTPPDGLTSSGNQGGPFSPSSKVYTLQNTGGSSINWTASVTQTWVSLSSTSGTLTAGASTTVTVSINSNANSLAPGSYSDTVSFTNTTNGSGNTTRPVSLTVSTAPTGLTVTPADGLLSSGNSGGPFSPSSKVYTLQNTGGSSINWTASVTQTWVSLSSTSGTLAAGASTTVTVSINSNANSLPANANPYSDTVTFTNTTNGNGNTTRTVSLTITGPPSGSITVTSPNGGENWAAGTTQTINWTYTGNPGSYVKIELLKGGKLNLTIYNSRSIGTAGSGSYSWPIRSTLAGGSDYQVRVTSTTNSAYTDTSDGFITITP